MARPVTLFTGQWADLPLEDMCRKASDFGYQGIELACWGDHFEVNKAVADPNYCSAKRDLLDRYDLQCHAISSHLVGQAVCDRIDQRHKAILPPHVWGDGDPAGVNRRAAEDMKNTARAAQQLGVGVVNGFTGSSIWPLLVFVPAGARCDDRRRLQAVRRSVESDSRCVRRVRRAVRARSASDGDRVRHLHGPRALDAIGNREEFGFNFDPSHLLWQGIDPVEFIREFPDFRIALLGSWNESELGPNAYEFLEVTGERQIFVTVTHLSMLLDDDARNDAIGRNVRSRWRRSGGRAGKTVASPRSASSRLTRRFRLAGADRPRPARSSSPPASTCRRRGLSPCPTETSGPTWQRRPAGVRRARASRRSG